MTGARRCECVRSTRGVRGTGGSSLKSIVICERY